MIVVWAAKVHVTVTEFKGHTTEVLRRISCEAES